MYKPIVLLLGLLVAVSIACGVSSPGATPTPTPLLPDTLCLDVQEKFIDVPRAPDLPVEETIRRLLESLGRQVVPAGGDCQASLSVQLNFIPLGMEYTGLFTSSAYCYTGAEVKGLFSITPSAGEAANISLDEKNAPLQGVVLHECPDESQAPFDDVWRRLVIKGLQRAAGDLAVIKAMQDPDGQVSSAANVLAGDLDPRQWEVLPALKQAYQDPEPGVRTSAISGMGALVEEHERRLNQEQYQPTPAFGKAPDKQADRQQLENLRQEVLTVLIGALNNDPDARVRSVAAWYLGVIGQCQEQVVAALGEALRGSEAGVIGSAKQALERCPGTEALILPALLAGLESGDPLIVESAVNEIEFMGDEAVKQALPVLAKVIESGSEQVVDAVLNGMLGYDHSAREIVPTLIAVLREGRYTPRHKTRAASILHSITGVDLDEDAQAWQDWWEQHK
jgi:HEAT repeat protein